MYMYSLYPLLILKIPLSHLSHCSHRLWRGTLRSSLQMHCSLCSRLELDWGLPLSCLVCVLSPSPSLDAAQSIQEGPLSLRSLSPS